MAGLVARRKLFWLKSSRLFLSEINLSVNLLGHMDGRICHISGQPV